MKIVCEYLENGEEMMDKLKRYIKTEADVEIFSCVHGISLIFIYGFLLWILGINSVPFTVIFQMFLLGYAISWFQKCLFLREKIYKKREYKIRIVLWIVGPVFMMIICQYIFHWFIKTPYYVALIYDTVMLSYFIMLYFFIEIFYKKDTFELNKMLSSYKNNIGDVIDE